MIVSDMNTSIQLSPCMLCNSPAHIETRIPDGISTDPTQTYTCSRSMYRKDEPGTCGAVSFLTVQTWNDYNILTHGDSKTQSLSHEGGMIMAPPVQPRVGQFLDLSMDPSFLEYVENIRAHFAEEAIELLQAVKMSQDELVWIANRVYSKDVGEVSQEIAGATNTLAALANFFHVDMNRVAHEDLDRLWENPESFRKRQLAKARYEAV